MFGEPMWRKLEREQRMGQTFPELNGTSADDVLSVDAQTTRDGTGTVTDFSQRVMQLARYAAEEVQRKARDDEQQRNASGPMPDLVDQGSARGVTTPLVSQLAPPEQPKKQPGVPRGVAEAFPETVGAGPVYGTPGTLSEPGKLINEPFFGDAPSALPGPIRAAVDVATTPRTWLQAAGAAGIGAVAGPAISSIPYIGGLASGAITPFGSEAGVIANTIGQVGVDALGAAGSELAGELTPESAPAPVQIGARVAGGLLGGLAGMGLASGLRSGTRDALSELLTERPALTPAFSISGGAAPLNPAAVKAPAGSALNAAAQTALSSKSTIPVGVARTLDQARTMVQADRPGLLAQAMYKIPGMKNLLRPGLDLPDNIIEAYAGSTSARAEFAQQAFQTRRPLYNALDTQFGADASIGNLTSARFIGGVADRTAPGVGARYPGTGTLYDILQRPEMYDLTPNQQALVSAFDSRNDSLRVLAVEDYGSDIGQFVRDAGGAYVPNIDRSDAAKSIDEAIGRSQSSGVASGRAKTRVFESGFDRWKADQEAVQAGRMKPEQVFVPETNIRLLTEGMDSFKESSVAAQVMKAGLGGKTRLQVVQETHPALYQQMIGLRQRLTNLQGTASRLDSKLDETIQDFMSSPMEPTDLNVLLANLNPKSVRGSVAGMDEAAIRAEIGNLRDHIHDLKPAWDSANPRGYTFVADGIYRYFPPEQIPQIKTLLKTEVHGLFRAISDINGTVLSGDFSPIIGQQGQLAWLTAPLQTTKAIFGGVVRGAVKGEPLRAFKADALAEDVAKSPQSWQDFAFYTGRAAAPGNIPGEFGGGWIARVPVVGEKFQAANDAIYTGVIRAQKRIYDDQVAGLLKQGLPQQEANAVAARSAMGVIPTPNTSMAGLSKAQAGALRTPFTSMTFMQRPAQMISEATEGMLNLAIPGRTVTPVQKLAISNIIKMNGTIAALAASSGAIYAKQNGLDPEQAALDAINPNDKHFMSIVLPNGSRIPLGGPYRAVFKAIAPAPVKTGDGEEVWVPFAGTYNFLKNRVSPVVGTQVDVLRNEDFYGNKIMTRDFPMNIAQLAEYELENAVPLSAGSLIGAARTQGLDAFTAGKGLGETLTSAVANVAGTNVGLPSPTDRLNLKAQDQFGKDFYDLEPAQQQAIREANPDLAQQQLEKSSDRTQEGAAVRADAFEQQLGIDDALKVAREQHDPSAFQDWKDATDSLRDRTDGALGQVYKDSPKKEPDPNKPWEVYGKVIADNTDPVTKRTNWDAVDVWRASLTDSQNAAIDRNTGLRSTPYQKERRSISHKLDAAGYFDIRDTVWAKISQDGKRFGKTPEELQQKIATKVYDAIINNNGSVQQAEIAAKRVVSENGILQRWTEISNNIEQGWIVKNRELAADAMQYGFFQNLREAEELAVMSGSRQ